MVVATRPYFKTGGNFGSPKMDLGGCVFYAPLWREDQKALTGATFQSKGVYGIPTHSCTVTGALWTPPTGYSFDGNDLITLPDPASLQLTGDITVISWVKRTASGANHTIASKYDTASQRGWALYFQSTDTIAWVISKDGTATTTLATSETYTDTAQWLQVAGVYKSIADGSSEMTLYVNGIVKASTAIAVSPLHNSIDPIRIGVMQVNNVNAYFMVGTIGEVLFYSRALSVSEIRNLYLATRWRFQ